MFYIKPMNSVKGRRKLRQAAVDCPSARAAAFLFFDFLASSTTGLPDYVTIVLLDRRVVTRTKYRLVGPDRELAI